MKKTIAILLSVIMLALSFNAAVYAADAGGFSISISADKTTLEPGDTVKVEFKVTDITAPSGMIGLDMAVNYDADRFVPVAKEGIYPEDWGTSGADFSPEAEKNGDDYTGVWQTYVLFDSDDSGHGVREDNVFGIALTFKVVQNAAGGSAEFRVASGATLTGASDTLETVMGKGSELRVVIEGVHKLILKQESSFKLEDAFVKGVAPGMTADTVIGNFENDGLSVRAADGTEQGGDKIVGTGYSVALTVDGNVAASATIIVKGDVDGNGKIETTDYIIIKRQFLRMTVLTGANFCAADVDGNGSIDSTDYIAIKRHILGISIIK
ncbi:MAG: hypothetical protein IJS94_00600 [Clostridia bacterium]|nr:hypothetical protein [Clostridia bacterium]